MDYLRKLGLAALLALISSATLAQVHPSVPANTLQGNALSTRGAVTPLTVSQVNSLLGINSVAIPAGLSSTQLTTLFPASNYALNTLYATRDAGIVQGNGSAWVQGSQFGLFQSGIDFIYMPSGTMGNNCAFTVPALDNTYTNAYAYFGPGAIATSSQPGWYYVVMTSTTNGTCFQNQYMFGQPTIPSSLTAFSTTGPGAFTALTNTGIPGYSINIPPFAMGVNGRIDIKASWTASNTTTSKAIAVLYGNSNTGSDSEQQTNVTNLTTTRTIINRGAISSQVTNGVNGSGALSGPNFQTVDGTVNQTMWIAFNRLTAATDWMVMHYVAIDLRPAGALDLPAAQVIPIGSATVPPNCAASFGFNTNKWYLRPTAASVSLTTNTTSPLFAAPGQTQPHFTTVNGMLSLNQLGDGVNVGVDSINSSNVAGTLATLPSANGWYFEVGAMLSTSDHDSWPATYSNPTEKFISGSTPYVEVDGDEKIGAISSNIPFNGSTESTLDWSAGSSGASTTHNNLSQAILGFSIDRTQWHTFGWGYDPITKQTFYCLDNTRQPYSQSTAAFDSDIATLHYFLVLNASSHGLHVPYNMLVSYVSAWSTH